MSLQDRVTQDLTAAMKARDRARTGALRLLVAALKNEAVTQGRGPQGSLTDDEVQRVLATEKKRRDEAADAFASAGRQEQASAERAESALIASYLPEQLTDDELEEAIDIVIARVGASGPRDMGAVMREIMAEVGNRAEGGRVSAEVRERLQALAG